ncbi:hypothetical protein E8E12_010868 [Didymella heteroderae]|uniref:DNA mismatch repair protein S5 domain-containing protein n=1 Tax=Didymella heteroderae TaxID=1769908 RepID=A0A9P4X0C5_9PLEO|nr:hypothetical protein E8E12_010868 [Didymella heteroderae]
MADDPESSTPKSIAALPPTTVRQIGSHQLLTDPSSVVKELVDNALDARAKSIFIDIAANTIDSVQVKDDGHGIPNEDRALACRRYCTSKIRDFQDLKEVGIKWLGFRGEALASIADMSGTMSITTRVEGEPVAVKLTYQRNGELTTTERESHPVGTTVKVAKLLETAKVRQDLAIKGAAKCLAKIRRLLQAYALARPAIRFRLHVLKTKNNKGDFVYAPKANANVEDAALKIVGKDCALQCDWTAHELDGFEVHAFMPKPTAVGYKIASHGAFIAVDFRPVASTRGTLKKIAGAVRDRLRKTNAALANIKDPFFCLNVICPVDSYDPNVEPAKDDVVFGDENFILTLVDRLLVCNYPENVNIADPGEDLKDSTALRLFQTAEGLESSSRPRTSSSMHKAVPVEGTEASEPAAQSQSPQWRSSMYGIDEEDLEFLQEKLGDMLEEEEDCRHDATISNPWTIARMNAPIKSKKPVSNGQLLSPAKSLTQEMDAFFQLHQDAAPAPSASQICTSRPSRNASVPAARPASRQRRRRTTDGGLQRTKSCTLPLNLIPDGFGTHNLTFPITTSVSSIAQHARNLDMSANTLEWGYDSTESFDTFRTRISERIIVQWVTKVDDLLAEVFERRAVEIRGALHEGIQRFLDLRKGEDELANERTVVLIDDTPVPAEKVGTRSPDAVGSGCGLPTRGLRRDRADTSVCTRTSSGAAVAGPTREAAGDAVVDIDEFDEGFDIEQFVDLVGGVAGQDATEQVVKNEDDDEMLMDL